MPIQYINVGVNPNDGTGDDLRSAFLKVNDNFQLLATIGGETNYGENIGGGSGQVYARKANEALQFRSLAAGTGITVNQSGDVITIGNLFVQPATITKINANVGTTESTGPGGVINILGGTGGTVNTRISGNNLYIDGQFALSDDISPTLSNSLVLNGKNIIGVGNISNEGTITTDTLLVGRSSGPGNNPGVATIAGSLTVTSSSTLRAVTATTLSATTSITSPSITATTNGFTGFLTGNTTGIHYGNVNILGTGGDPDTIVIDTAAAPATINGNVFGNISSPLC